MPTIISKKTASAKNVLPPALSEYTYKIAISGAADTDHFPAEGLEKARELGRLIAQKKMVLVTGATTGAPLWAARGAKEAGGVVIGLSPASSKAQHVRTYRLPVDYHDLIIYTGFGYSGRNLFFVRSADAVISVEGRIGTLNEFTDAFEDKKPQGVLLGDGSTTDLIPEIMKVAHRGRGKVVFDHHPAPLLEKVIALIEEENRRLKI